MKVKAIFSGVVDCNCNWIPRIDGLLALPQSSELSLQLSTLQREKNQEFEQPSNHLPTRNIPPVAMPPHFPQEAAIAVPELRRTNMFMQS